MYIWVLKYFLIKACCEQYPLMVAWTWQMDQCTDSCYMAKTPTRCCVLSCVFYMIGVLKANFNADGSVASTVVDPAGLIYSFMLSVGNDTQWEPIITESVNWCNDQYGGVTSKYECKVIPLNLYEIVDCTTVQDYLKCPPWNPHNLPECQQTQEFVRDCLA